MNKVTLKIDGMMCSMCEAHINDVIRREVPQAKKVASSRKKGESTFLIDGSFDESKLKDAIKNTGYELKGISSDEYKKKAYSVKKI